MRPAIHADAARSPQLRALIAGSLAACAATAAWLIPAPGLRAQVPDAPDLRLEQKITYAASAAPLLKVADGLSSKTGIILRVGFGDRDWQTRERKVHVSFQNLPLGTALAQLSKTLGYQLRRTGKEEQWSYRIWQTNAAREYEAAMLTDQTEAADREVAALRETVLKDADAVAAMSPQDAMQLRDKDPWRAYLGGTDSGRAYAQILRSLPPETRELMLRGHKVTLEASDLSPDLQQALPSMIPKSLLAEMGTSMGPAGQLLSKLAPARIIFQPLTPEMGAGSAAASGIAGLALVMGDMKDPSPEQQQLMDQISIGGMGKGVPIIGLPLAGGDSTIGRVIGSMMLRLDAGEPYMTVQRDMIGQMMSARQTEEDRARKITPSPKPTDPALLAEVDPLALKLDLTRKASQSADLIQQLAKKTPLSYVYEYYPEETPLSSVLPATKEPLYKLLDSLQAAGLAWEYEKGVVRIRPKDWAVQRSYDVPESVLATYRKLLKAQGWFDLDTLAAIATALTDGQIQHRFLTDPDLQATAIGFVSIGSANRALLRLYGSLTPDQKVRIKSSEGLPFDGLAQEQWQRIAAVVDDDTGGVEVQAGRITLAMADFPPASMIGPSAGKAGQGVGAAPVKGEAPAAGAPKADKAAPASATEAAPEPIFRTAMFTIEVQGDTPDAPYRIKKTIMVPGKTQIAQVRKQLEDLSKPQKEKPEDKATKPGTAKPGTAKPSAAKPGTAKPSTATPGAIGPGAAKTDANP